MEVEKNERNLRKIMDYCNKSGVPFVIILGENEIQEGTIKLKNMETGEDLLFKLSQTNEIANHIKKLK